MQAGEWNLDEAILISEGDRLGKKNLEVVGEGQMSHRACSSASCAEGADLRFCIDR